MFTEEAVHKENQDLTMLTVCTGVSSYAVTVVFVDHVSASSVVFAW
jgi:hypothetical protein